MVLYILLCGYPPFFGDTDADTRRLILETKVGFDPREWGSVSPGAKQLIERMLSHDASLRPTAVECLADPWTAQNARHLTEPLPRSVLRSIRSFRTHERMKREV